MKLKMLIAATVVLCAFAGQARAAGPIVCANTVLTGVVRGPLLVVPAGTTCTFDHAIVAGGYSVDGSINATNGTTQSGGERVGENYTSDHSSASGGLTVGGAESLVSSSVSGGNTCGVLLVFVNSTITGPRNCF